MERKNVLRILLSTIIIVIFIGISINDTLASISLTLNEENVTLKKGETIILEATIIPGDVDVSFVWSSSNENIAVVDSHGNVQAINEGIATIRVSNCYDVEATCIVTVVDSTNSNQYILLCAGIAIVMLFMISYKKLKKS